MTGAPADIPKYFYWSERRIARIFADGGIKINRSGSIKVKSPTAPFLPGLEVDRPRAERGRPQIASMIERYLDGNTVRDFVTPPPVRFAAGCGPLTFAEFINYGKREDLVSIFTHCVASDGAHVAVGMFGSKGNLADVIGDIPTSDTNWSSSSANEIFRFISSNGREIGGNSDVETTATDALQLLLFQGGNLALGEKRGFTYGHMGEAGEWMMEAYLDREFGTPKFGYHRIVIGAPLWVRTSKPEALVIHAPDSATAASVRGESRASVGPSRWKRLLG